MSRDRLREECTICTAVAPEAVFTVRTWAIRVAYDPKLVRKFPLPAHQHRRSQTYAAAATERVRAWAAPHRVETDELDGLTLVHPGGDDPMWWLNLRASNTEPLLRLNVEAADAVTMAAIRDDVLSVVRRPARGDS